MLWPWNMTIIRTSGLILAFDTAARACSVALARDDKVLFRAKEKRERGHAEVLLPMVRQVMAEAGKAFSDLDAIAVTVGPGTFTGIRIGVAAARGLALAAGKPVVPLTTMEVLAANAYENGASATPTLAVLDARRGGVYWQLFSADGGPLTNPAVDEPKYIPKLLAGLNAGPRLNVVGNGTDLVAGVLSDTGTAILRPQADGEPDAGAAAKLASRKEKVPGGTVTPLYLRPADAIPQTPRGSTV